MEKLDRAALELAAPEFDAAVSRAEGLDHFCSSTPWTLSADVALVPPRELYCRRSEHGWVLLARRRYDHGGASLEPLESAWCLACPVVCVGDPASLAADLASELALTAPDDVVFLSGLVPGSLLARALAASLRARYALRSTVIPPTRRFRASLDGGVAGFFDRRSAGFRASLRQAVRRAERAGVRFEPIVVMTEAEALTLHARLLAVESRSWKGLGGEGLAVPEMAELYREMLPRLARTGSVRAQVGRLEGEDVALIVGAVGPTPSGSVYRGLQFSFDDKHRGLSLGNVAQLAQIEALVAEGVGLYDLGSEVDYKRRWGEQCFETMTLIAIPRPPSSRGDRARFAAETDAMDVH